MKKIAISFIILLMAMFIYQTSYAVDAGDGASIEFNFSGDSKITKGTKTVSYTISLGAFQGIDNSMMAYSGVLEYDSNVFESVAIEGLNNWSGTYEPSTNRILGETGSNVVAEQNKPIGKITLTLKDDVQAGSTTVRLKNVEVSTKDEKGFDNYSVEATLTIEEEPQEEPKNETPEENTAGDQNKQEENNNNQAGSLTNSNSNNTSNEANEFQSLTSNKTENKAKTALPKTGTGKIALFVIMIAIVGIGCLIKYKSIETK